MKTEQELRESESFSPKSIEELNQYINELVNQKHDYGTCVYAMSLSAVATFNYVAHKLGVTGFQASCADLDILTRTRSIKGPFAIIKGEEMLYPQYNILREVQKYLREWEDWASNEAKKLMDKHPNGINPHIHKFEDGEEMEMHDVHPDVWRHWENLARKKHEI